MLVQETRDERIERRREEMDRIAINYKDKEAERKFKLELAKIETSSPKRWEAIREIFATIFLMPVLFIWTICCFILIISKREVPDWFK